MASSRGNPDIGDIVRSMVLIGAVILALYGFSRFFSTTPEQKIATVDYQDVVTQAQPATDVPLLTPDPLPAGWQATSARFEVGSRGGSWHLGMLTDDDEYLGLEQTPLTTERAIDRWAPDSDPAGSAQVAGQVWEVRAGPGDRIAYVTREDGRTTLVNGTVSQPELEAYISSLEPSAS